MIALLRAAAIGMIDTAISHIDADRRRTARIVFLSNRIAKLEEIVEELAWEACPPRVEVPAGRHVELYECRLCGAATIDPGSDAHEPECAARPA